MKLKTFLTMFGVLCYALAIVTSVRAQADNRIGSTWNNQNSLLIGDALQENASHKASKPKVGNKAVGGAVLKFKPARDSGVAKNLADALGKNAAEKATLKTAFLQIKQAYENEVAKAKRSNDLAAAMTFFIASNVMAYGQTAEPSDDVSEQLYKSLQNVMAGIPEFAKMPGGDKQKLHDWLVIMAGYVMFGSNDARQSGDAAGLQTFKEMADYSMRLVLGIEAANLSLSDAGLAIESTPPSNTTATSNSASQVVGVWSKSASSPWSLAPTAILTNVGYYKGRYIFAANGTYNFKGESWGGHLRSQEYWTFEENGYYSVSGTSLTISPKASKRTQRNRAGVVQKTQDNALEKATYQWQLHYFEGIQELNLVLKPAKPVARDGGFSTNEMFPNSYLYGQHDHLEWKF